MSGNRRALRIRVAEGDDPKVNITVPLGLARLARVGGITQAISERDEIDLEAILREIEELPDGRLVDVTDEKTGDRVEISVETLGAADAAATDGAAAAHR